MLLNRRAINVLIFIILLLFTSRVSFSQSENQLNDSVAKLWNDWLNENNGKTEINLEGLQKIKDLLLDNGIQSHPYLTYAIIREAQRRANYNPDSALQLLDFFEDTYKSLSPEPFFLSSKIYLKHKDYTKGIGKILDGLNVYLKNSLYLLEVTGNISIFILLALLLSAFTFIVLMFVKYLKLLLHDFSDLYPSFVPRIASFLLGLTLLLLPLIFHLGIVITLLVWLLVVAGYLTWRERVVLYGISISLIILPFILSFLGSFVLSVSEKGSIEMELIRNFYWDTDIIERLESLTRKDPTNKNIKYSLANAYKKSGRLDEALEIYNTLLETDLKPCVLNNIANIELALGKIDSAVNRYREAISIRETLPEAHYNLGQILILKDPFGSEGLDEVERAKELSPELVSYYTRIYDGKNINRRAIDVSLSKWDLLKEFFKFSPDKINVFTSVIPVFFNLKSEWTASIIGFILIFSILIIFIIQNKFMIFSSFCIKCNGVVCPRCTRNAQNLSYCNECNKFYIQKSAIDSRELYRLEKSRYFWKSVRTQIFRIVNIVFPGAGLIYNGWTFTGIIIFTIIFSLFIRILIGTNPLSYHLNLIYVPELFLKIVFIFIILIFYVIAQIIYYRNE
jgi:tetratricopeptide (TPR) repeat protein